MAGQFNGSGVAAPAERGGLEVDERWFENVVVVTVAGELDLLTTPQLTDAIESAASRSPVGVIVDLSKLEFLASAGMNALVAANREISRLARFAVVADGPATARPLKLIGLDKVVALHPTLADAFASFIAS